MHSLWEHTECMNESVIRKNVPNYSTIRVQNKDLWRINALYDTQDMLRSIYAAYSLKNQCIGNPLRKILTVGRIHNETIDYSNIFHNIHGIVMQVSPTEKHAKDNYSLHLDGFISFKRTVAAQQYVSIDGRTTNTYICDPNIKRCIINYCDETDLFFDTAVISNPVDVSEYNMHYMLKAIRAVMKPRGELLMKITNGGGFIAKQFIYVLNSHLYNWMLHNHHLFVTDYPDLFAEGLTTLDIDMELKQLNVPKYIIDTEYVFGNKDEWCEYVEKVFDVLAMRIANFQPWKDMKHKADAIVEDLKLTKKALIDGADNLCQINPMYENIYVYASMDGKML